MVWQTPIRDDKPGRWTVLDLTSGSDSFLNLGIAYVNAGGDLNKLGRTLPRK